MTSFVSTAKDATRTESIAADVSDSARTGNRHRRIDRDAGLMFMCMRARETKTDSENESYHS